MPPLHTTSCKWRNSSEAMRHPARAKRRDPQEGEACGGSPCADGAAWPVESIHLASPCTLEPSWSSSQKLLQLMPCLTPAPAPGPISTQSCGCTFLWGPRSPPVSDTLLHFSRILLWLLSAPQFSSSLLLHFLGGLNEITDTKHWTQCPGHDELSQCQGLWLQGMMSCNG